MASAIHDDVHGWERGMTVVADYVAHAKERFERSGGFQLVDIDAAPPGLGEWSDVVLRRVEPGLITYVAFIPQVAYLNPGAIREDLSSWAEQAIGEQRADMVILTLLICADPVNRERFDRWQGLKLNEPHIRVLPWVVDLPRSIVFEHEGPPFGVDPGLAHLATPFADGDPPPTPRREPGPRPWATYALLAAIVGIYVAMVLTVGSVEGASSEDVLLRWGAAARPHLWLERSTWRLLTANFLHIGYIHLALNGISLWNVGRAVEQLFGPGRMLYIFLVSGVLGAMTSAVFGPPVVLSAGASGAIFGLAGAIVWFRFASPLGNRIAWRPLVLSLVINLGLGLALYSFVDNWDHIGGLVGGVVAAAATGVPLIAGTDPTRWTLPRRVHRVLALGLAAVVGLVVAGTIPLPGSGRTLAAAIESVNSQRPTDAEAPLRQLISRYPADPDLHRYLAISLSRQGRCAAAAQEWQVFRQLYPPDLLTSDLLADMAACSSQ